MTIALLSAAAAVLIWPFRSSPVRRLASRGRPAGIPLLRSTRAAVPPAVLAPAATVVIGILLSTPLVAGLAGGCTAFAVRAVREHRKRARMDGALLGLAEAVGVLAAELRAGRPLVTAVTTAVESCPDTGVARALADTLGRPGLEAATGPAPPPSPLDPFLHGLRAAVELSVRTGCPLGDVAAAVADDLRARHRQLLELRAAAAGPRASAAVLAGLPLVGLAMGGGIGADPWAVLTTTGVGQVLLVAGVLLEVAGIAWVGRLLSRASPDAAAGSRRG